MILSNTIKVLNIKLQYMKCCMFSITKTTYYSPLHDDKNQQPSKVRYGGNGEICLKNLII